MSTIEIIMAHHVTTWQTASAAGFDCSCGERVVAFDMLDVLMAADRHEREVAR